MAEWVRKRDRYTRARAKRTRPKTPAPKTGWLIRQLSQLTQVSVRTLRNYVSKGLLTPTELRGTITRYQRRELLRLVLVLRARQGTKLTLAEIKADLDQLTDAELEARVRAASVPIAIAAALDISAEPAVAPDPNDELALEGQPWSSALENWQRVRLLPGLELLLGPDASPAAVRAAHRICSEYVG